jgi:hypothetical protein
MDYKNGKIYTIRSQQCEKYYIGSTTQPLYKRFNIHKRHYEIYKNGKMHYISSFEIIKFDDCYIELLENFSCNSKEELNKREGELIRQLKDSIVNKRIEKRTNKEWRNDNNYLDYMKERYIKNKDKLNEQNNKYYIENKEKRLEYAKIYRNNNIESIKEKTKLTYTCECGRTLTISKKSRHVKTKIHLNFTNKTNML